MLREKSGIKNTQKEARKKKLKKIEQSQQPNILTHKC